MIILRKFNLIVLKTPIGYSIITICPQRLNAKQLLNFNNSWWYNPFYVFYFNLIIFNIFSFKCNIISERNTKIYFQDRLKMKYNIKGWSLSQLWDT